MHASIHKNKSIVCPKLVLLYFKIDSKRLISSFCFYWVCSQCVSYHHPEWKCNLIFDNFLCCINIQSFFNSQTAGHFLCIWQSYFFLLLSSYIFRVFNNNNNILIIQKEKREKLFEYTRTQCTRHITGIPVSNCIMLKMYSSDYFLKHCKWNVCAAYT